MSDPISTLVPKSLHEARDTIIKQAREIERLEAEIDALRAANVKMSHQIDTLCSVHKATTDVVQIFGDQLMIEQVSAVGGWPEQVDETLVAGGQDQ